MTLGMAFSRNDKYVGLVLSHIALGILFYIATPFSKLFFLVILFYFLRKIIIAPPSQKVQQVLLASAYFTGAEILFRMTKGGIAYESSKYLVVLFMLIGMFYKGLSGKAYPYFIYLMLLVPSILVASMTLTFDANFRTNIMFVLTGPVCLGVAALFCYDKKVSQKQLLDIITYMALPCIATAVYLFLYNPSVKDVLSGTASNSATSGGFGPNQVSTILGLGMFCIVVRLFLQSPNLFLKLLNLSIFSAMTFRAIVTFSRGGVYAAIIVVLAFLVILYFKANFKLKQQLIVSFILFSGFIALTWVFSSLQTEGLIDKRYANEDALGREKEQVATGRVQLFQEEVESFMENPFFGIGASRTKNQRVELEGKKLSSHNEISRLLAEHGSLGIVMLIILLLKPLSYRINNRNNVFFYAFLAFWFATINHSGMRIAAPAFVYALALLHVTNEKRPLHRKQIKPSAA